MYISVRITPEHCNKLDFGWDVDKGDLMTNKVFWYHFTSRWFENVDQYILCYEKSNKFGEPCSPHYHINIYGDIKVKKETLQKWFNKHGAKGSKAYCIQVREDVEDEGRWWRYCCKENLVVSYGFSDDRIEQMVEMATSERSHQVKSNVKTRDRLVMKNQFRDKLFKYLKEQHEQVSDTRRLIKLIGEYYQSQGKTPPFSKLFDVALDYQVVSKMVSWEDWIEERYAHRGG